MAMDGQIGKVVNIERCQGELHVVGCISLQVRHQYLGINDMDATKTYFL